MQDFKRKKRDDLALEYFLGAYTLLSKLSIEAFPNLGDEVRGLAFNIHIISVRGYSWVKELAEKRVLENTVAA